MAGIGFLFYGLLRAACAIGRTVDNEQMKKLTMHTDDNGNQVCYGRRGQEYINGEKTCMRFQEDKNGHNHALTIGSSSGKVYKDSYDRVMDRMERYSEKNKELYLKMGKAAYPRYDPRFGKEVTTEMETERVITCLYEGVDENKNPEYRKWYFRPECQGKYDYDQTVEGDWGIVISKEEYDKLQIVAPTYRKIPSDTYIRKVLWGEIPRNEVNECE